MTRMLGLTSFQQQSGAMQQMIKAATLLQINLAAPKLTGLGLSRG